MHQRFCVRDWRRSCRSGGTAWLRGRGVLWAVCWLWLTCACGGPGGAAVDGGEHADAVSLADAPTVDAAAADSGSCRAPGCSCTTAADCATVCLEHRDGASRCAVPCQGDAGCAKGQKCAQVGGISVCVEPDLALCDPCASINDCKVQGISGAQCVAGPDGVGRCGMLCKDGPDCPAGYNCQDVTAVGGGAVRQCVPEQGACGCSPRAVQKKLAVACSAPGACGGQRVCTDQGLSPCQGKEAAPELCNGLDDDCDGATDEGVSCDDGNPCSLDTCGGILGCAHSDPVIGCDDDNPCTTDPCDAKLGCLHFDKPGCVVPVPYAQGFSCKTLPPWTLSQGIAGQPRWGIDALPSLGVATPGYRSPDCSLNFNLGTSLACQPTGTTADGTATSPRISALSLSPDAALRLRFYLAGSWRPIDKLVAEVSEDGAVWTEVAAFDPPAGGLWHLVDADLAAWIGKTFKVRLRFVAPFCDEAGAVPGPFVDDLQVGDVSCVKVSECDDDDPCTDDLCIGASHLCKHKPSSGAPCSDGNPCTISDQCYQGSCEGKKVLSALCDDGDACTGQDKCSGGECQGSPLQGPCDDGNPCTTQDHCDLAAGCAGEQKACDDGNACTYDVCDVASGACASAPASETVACDDGDPCTDVGYCHAGQCLSRMPCDDNNPCTKDFCALPSNACVHLPVPEGQVCSDGDACSADETCTAAGFCKGTAAACSAVSIQWPACSGDPAWQLSAPSVPEGASWRFVQLDKALGTGCALAFTRGDDITCVGSQSHVVGSAVRTYDLQNLPRPVLRLHSHAEVGNQTAINLRWVDVRSVGTAAWTPTWLPNDVQGAAPWREVRVDLSPWTGKTVEVRLMLDSGGCPAPVGRGWFIDKISLDAGVATPCNSPAECEDGNACTADGCVGHCVRQYLAGPCDDGDACAGPDTCAILGECQGSKPADCQDDDACTIDSCDASKGCLHAPRPDGEPCLDGDPCTVGEACLAGKCLVRPKCQDGNACTVDSCGTDGTCSHDAVLGGTPCDDANPCTDKDFCTQGQCQGAAIPCKAGWSDAAACGATAWTLSAASWAGAPAWAVDQSPQPPAAHSPPCTLNVNNGALLGCSANGTAGQASAVSPPIDLSGLVAPALWLWTLHDGPAAANVNARFVEVSADAFVTTPLQVWLDNSVPTQVWQPLHLSLAPLAGKKIQVRLRWVGLGCPSVPGKGWFVDDVTVMSAQPAKCNGAADCGDGNPCTLDVCDKGACTFPFDPTPCDDGDGCTVADVCTLGLCAGTPGSCDDGNPCTQDICKAAVGCSHVPKIDGAICDDNDSCTASETCKNATCIGKPSPDGVSCIDGDQCVMGQTCKAGVCQGGQSQPDGAACNDLSSCTAAETCVKGQCQAAINACDDHEACTLDSCFATTQTQFACGHQPLADLTSCDDGDPCTAPTLCTQGRCEGPQVAGCWDLTGSSFDDAKVPSGWLVDPPLNGVGWAIDATPTPPPPHSPPLTLNFNNGKNFDSGVPVSAGFETPLVQVPLQGQPQLTFWSWHAGEPAATKDKRWLEIYVGAAKTPDQALQLPNHLRRGLWSKIWVPLTKYGGKPIRVRLRFESVDQFDNEAPGWFIDDFHLQSAQPSQCKLDAECVQGAEPCQPTLCQSGKCVGVVLTGACDDGDDCTTQTVCSAGVCQGKPVDCDDGYACTVDSCAKKGGCAHKEVFGCGVFAIPFSDKFSCGTESLSYWKRDPSPAAGGPAWAFDATPATPGAWSGDCALNFNDGKSTACPPGVAKLDALVMSPQFDLSSLKPKAPAGARFQLAGSWQPGAGEQLSVEVQPLGATGWTLLATPAPLPGWRTVGLDFTPWAGLQLRVRLRFVSACQGGAGTGPFVDDFEVFDAACKTDAACDDADPCTTDACNTQGGVCQHDAASGPSCDDGNPCTLGDSCVTGQCLGAPKLCDDGKPCTQDVCDPSSGQCSATASPEGSPCSDANPCTSSDSCAAGACQGQAKADASPCSDGNGCTTGDNCLAGLCKGTGAQPDGTPCTDGNPCTAADTCKAAACVGVAETCDDGNPCTLDSCVPVGALSKQCLHVGGCP